MQEIGKLTLLNKTGRLIGFGYGSNILRSGWWIAFNFYRISGGWVICISEGQGQYDVELARGALGQTVPGGNFVNFAA